MLELEQGNKTLQKILQGLNQKKFAPLDFMGKGTLVERVLSLVLGEEVPPGIPGASSEWQDLIQGLRDVDLGDLRVVALGGGTGLSRIVGGDSRRPEWTKAPFTGLKELFPQLHSIVCITDDGGSTGEMLKDFPIIGLGDLRHVLLASVRSSKLKKQYQLDDQRATETAVALYKLFNCRFSLCPDNPEQLWAESRVAPSMFPAPLAAYLSDGIRQLFNDKRLKVAMQRPQCLGNLLLAAAIYGKLPSFFRTAELIANQKRMQTAIMEGISDLALAIGAGKEAVLPCTVTPAQLQMLYADGVLVTGESKAGAAFRGYPVERALVRFSDTPLLPDAVAEQLRAADIIIMAPGSLYTSIIPILQVPGLADLIRENTKALKLLVANIWVQKGETDATLTAPEKRFHVSDLIQAYSHNISGGVQGLFSHVLTLDLSDIPGSVLQSYALEKKEPIYVDSERVRGLGFEPIQTRIFSQDLLRHRHVIQHDSVALSKVIRSLWALRLNDFLPLPQEVSQEQLQAVQILPTRICPDRLIPCIRYEEINRILEGLDYRQVSLTADFPLQGDSTIRQELLAALVEIVWRHPDIHPEHLRYVEGIRLVSIASWKRCQQWDTVYSFYDPEDACIKIRQDQIENPERLEMAFLVALGQSLLGNYCQEKRLEDVFYNEQRVGRIYSLSLRDAQSLNSLLSLEALDTYLQLSRMYPLAKHKRIYARTVNATEGFMPPGLLFGLFFAWYLDSRFAPNIDHMMSIMKHGVSDLAAEQVEKLQRRKKMIHFFRESVFRSNFL
jgi:uncharacterized cofD-like protein